MIRLSALKGLPGFFRGAHGVENRGRERLRKVMLTAFASLASRGSTVLTLLIAIPLALHRLGAERFGMWMIISSFTLLLSFTDFGIGNGVMNEVAAAYGTDDDLRIRRAVTNGRLLLAGIGAALLVALAASYPFVRWEEVFQVHSPRAIAEAGPSIAAFVLCLAISLPAGIGSKVQMGLQRGYLLNLTVGLGNLVAFILIIVGLKADWSVPALVLALFGLPAIAQVINQFIYLYIVHPQYKPDRHLVEWGLMKALLSAGGTFFFQQFFAVAVGRADALILAQFFGPETAGTYAVVDRAFSLVAVVSLAFLTPLWPAYREAIHRGDRDWATRTFKRSLILTVGVTGAMSIAIVAGEHWLFGHWIGRGFQVPFMLILGFAIWKVIEAASAAGAMFLNGAGALRAATVMAGGTGIAVISLKLIFVKSLGYSSIVWISAASYSLGWLLPLVFIVPRLLRRFPSDVPARSGDGQCLSGETLAAG